MRRKRNLKNNSQFSNKEKVYIQIHAIRPCYKTGDLKGDNLSQIHPNTFKVESEWVEVENLLIGSSIGNVHALYLG